MNQYDNILLNYFARLTKPAANSFLQLNITKRFHAISTFCSVSPVRFPEGTYAIRFWTATAGTLARLTRSRSGRLVRRVHWSMLKKGIALCFKLRPQKFRQTDGFRARLLSDGGELAESPSPIRVYTRKMFRSNTERCGAKGSIKKTSHHNSTMIASAGCSSKRKACNTSHALMIKNHT